MGFFAELYRNKYPVLDTTTVHTYVRLPAGGEQRELPGADALRPAVSLIATVKNEGGTIGAWLDSIGRQTRHPNEIVIVDGGSSDDTWPILQACAAQSLVPMKVLRSPGANIARGRNLAIEVAAGPIIACTDAGCVLDPGWLAAITGPFADDPAVEVSAGYYRGAIETDLHRIIAAYLIPPVELVNPQTFLPSARSLAFAKEAWSRAGGFPEWLTLAAEDTLFDIQLKKMTRRWALVPEAQVEWRLKSTLGGLFRQVRTYARGDGEAGLMPETYRRHIQQCVSIMAKAVAGATGAVLTLATGAPVWLILAVLAIALTAYQVYRMTLRPKGIPGQFNRFLNYFQSMLVAVSITLAMSIGYVQGVRKRIRQSETAAKALEPSPG